MSNAPAPKDGPAVDGAVTLPPSVVLHLRQALMRMDLVLQCDEVEMGLEHLVRMMQHLRAMRGVLS